MYKLFHIYNQVINWMYISIMLPLTENFIREFQDEVQWRLIFFNQKILEEFIKKFTEKIDNSGQWR